MSSPQENTEYVMLPVATRDFILQALRETNQALSKTHRLRATRHIMLVEGFKLSKENSFEIDHRDHLLLMNLAESLLGLNRKVDRNLDRELDREINR